MAGDWMKIEISLPEKPEVWQMSDILDIDPDAVVGKLIRVWGWFDTHTEEGNAASVSKRLLDRSVSVTGFCDAMTKVGWMVEEGGSVVLPKFERHNGKTAKKRAVTAKRVAKHKKKSNAEGNDTGNASSVNEALPREEKRREESSKEIPGGISAPSDKPLDAGDSDDDSDPVFVCIPLVDGSEHPVTESDIAEYAQTYPAVDVRHQLRRIRGWNLDTPERRKTKRGIRRHISGWLAKAQDRGGDYQKRPEKRIGGGQYTRNGAAAEQAARELTEALSHGQS